MVGDVRIGAVPASASTPRRSAEHWVVLALAGAGVLLLTGLGSLIEPDPRGYGTHERFGLQPCMPMQLWNVPCPGCGVTTSVTHAAHGAWAQSLRTQPFGLLLALGFVAFVVWALAAHVRGRDLWSELQRFPWGRAAAVVGVLVVVCWVYKLAAVREWIPT